MFSCTKPESINLTYGLPESISSITTIKKFSEIDINNIDSQSLILIDNDTKYYEYGL
ncbi:MAG: hypothetical protein ACK4OM_00025 [Alphaproteobacteria bacterium]